jgi:hypothetical protein
VGVAQRSNPEAAEFVSVEDGVVAEDGKILVLGLGDEVGEVGLGAMNFDRGHIS